MKEIGEILRSAREEKGISLDEISRLTKIQKRHLSSLEGGDFSSFPGEVYLRGALKNYAEAIGLSPKEVISTYEQMTGQKKNSEEKSELKLKEQKKQPIIRNEKKSLPTTALIWIIMLTIVIGGSIWYRHQQASNRDAQIPYSSELVLEDPLEEPDDPIIPVEDPPVSEPELFLLNMDNREALYIISGVDKKEVRLTFSGRCWVRIEQDGKLVEEKNYDAGENRLLGDSVETWIRFGYPPTAEVTVNGLKIEELNQITSPFNIIIRKEQ